MTAKQTAWFLAAYVALVAVAVWFNLAVLCQGDAKYDGGCGGFGIYIPLWEIFLAPLPLAAIVLEWKHRATPPPASRLVIYLAGILVIAEAGFLLIEKFPVLMVVEATAIVVAALPRRRAVSERR